MRVLRLFFFLFAAELPFVKLSDKMSSNYPFTMYENEGICDLYDINVEEPVSSLFADNEEMYEEDEDLVTECDTSAESLKLLF